MSLAHMFYAKQAYRRAMRYVRQWRQQRRTAHPARAFQLEALEPRLLMSASPATVFAPVELTRVDQQAIQTEGAKLPPGSLMYGSTLHDSFQSAGERDAYTLNADRGQRLTVEFLPQDQSVRGQIEIFDPNGILLGTAMASGAGGFAVLENIPLNQRGNYSLRATGLEGAGNYDAKVWLNTQRESEQLGGPTNNDLASAVNLSASSIALPGGGDRLAVVGSTDPAGDFYRLPLAAGQTLYALLTGLQPGGGTDLTLDLLDANGGVLAHGQASENADRAIRQFVAPTAGTYALKVTGSGAQDYSLVVTRDTAVDLEPNNTPIQAQDITLANRVLGGIPPSEFRVAVVGPSPEFSFYDLGFQHIVDQLNDQTYFKFEAQLVRPDDVDTMTELDAYDVVVIGNSGTADSDRFEQFAPALREWVEAGGGVVATGWTLFGASNGTPVSDIDAIIPVNTSVQGGSFSPSGSRFPRLLANGTSHPVIDGVGGFSTLRSIEYPAGTPQVDTGATVLALVDLTNAIVTAQPAVVVGMTGLGRSVYLGPTYAQSYSFGYASDDLRQGSADRLLEQAVAWARKGDRTDQYLVRTNEGDQFLITTATPGGEAGQPNNQLDPSLDLYDPSGVRVAFDHDSGIDSTNARISYTVPVGAAGIYRVVVSGSETVGYYTLAVAGATGTPIPYTATTVTPSAGALVSGFPATYRVDFSEPFLLSSIHSSDLLINGIAADSVTVVDSDTLDFGITGARNGDGVYTATIAPEALTSLSSKPLAAFTATFDVDATPPRVTTSSLHEGDVVATGALSVQLHFNESLNSTGLGPEDVVLRNTGSNATVVPTSFLYDAGTNSATVTFVNVEEGDYALTLTSGAAAFRDLRGNSLDGDGDGVGGDPYSVRFHVDLGTRSVSVPLQPVRPLGSLVYQASMDGRFHASNDVDIYTVNVEAGQRISVVLTPQDGSLLGHIELLAPDITSLGTVTAVTPGTPVLLQTSTTATSGQYTIRLQSQGGAGDYHAQVILNSAVEAETYGGTSNDTRSEAQAMNAELPLQGDAARLAIIGKTEVGDDFYRLDLTAGQAASFVLTTLQTGANLNLELQSSDGTRLALGTRDSTNAGPAIRDFVAPATGSYYLRVNGDVAQEYSLVANRQAAFEHEPNTNIGQQLNVTGQVLGSAPPADPAIRVAVVGAVAPPFFQEAGNNTGFQAIVDQLNDDTFFNFDAVLVTPSQVDTVVELSGYDVIVIGDNGYWEREANQLGSLAPALRSWVEAGGGVVATGWIIGGAGNSSGAPIADIDAIIPVNTSGSVNTNTSRITINSTVHPVTTGLNGFSLPLAGTSFTIETPRTSPTVDAGATILGTVSGRPAVVVGNPGAGRSVFLGPIYADPNSAPSAFRAGRADQLLEQAVAWARTVEKDVYAITVNENDHLVIETTTPGDEAGEPVNDLNPSIQLLDPAGNVVAQVDNGSTDGRNVFFTYDVPVGAGGAYRLLISSESASGGDYTIRVTGATGAQAPLTVAETNPADGAPLAVFPKYRVSFSDTLYLPSVDASDVRVNGIAADSVAIVDGRTLEFTIASANSGDGLYTVSM